MESSTQQILGGQSNATDKIRLPVLTHSSGYLKDLSTNRIVLDGDHYCQSCIKLYIDPTLENTSLIPREFSIFLRVTVSLRGVFRNNLKAGHVEDPEPYEPEIEQFSNAIHVYETPHPWDIPINESYLSAKDRPLSNGEREAPIFIREETHHVSWEKLQTPPQDHPNCQYQLVLSEWDFIFDVGQDKTNYIVRLPTSPGKGRYISSSYWAFALPRPMLPEDILPTPMLISAALNYAGFSRLNMDQWIKWSSYIQYEPPAGSKPLQELLPHVAQHIFEYASRNAPQTIGAVACHLLQVLTWIVNSKVPHERILSVPAHVKSLRKSKTAETRYTSESRLLSIVVP